MFGLKVLSTTSIVERSTLREAVTETDMTDRITKYCANTQSSWRADFQMYYS